MIKFTFIMFHKGIKNTILKLNIYTKYDKRDIFVSAYEGE